MIQAFHNKVIRVQAALYFSVVFIQNATLTLTVHDSTEMG